MIISLGIECTAHTFGIGIVREDGKILSNEKIVYTNPLGGIHPREAAEYHLKKFDKVLLKALDNAGFLIIRTKSKTYFFDLLGFLRDKLSFQEIIVYDKGRRRYIENAGLKIYVKDQTIIVSRDALSLENANLYELSCFLTKIKIKNDKYSEELLSKIVNVLRNITKEDLKKYKVNLIVVSRGPGLYPTLSLGIFIAKILSMKLDIPIVGVNHCIAHVEIAKLVTGFKDPVVIYVSGANTQIIAYEGGKYRVFGETLDMGIGNFLDSIGRLLGLGFPAGPKIEKLAEKGKRLIELPYTVKGMDIQLSGLYTYIKNLVEKKSDITIEDLAYSIQEHVFAMITEVAERAIAHLNKKEVVLTGGVAANKRLQKMIENMAKERGISFRPIPMDLASDNGAMIAWTGILWFRKGKIDKIGELKPAPYWRTDEVEI